VANLTDGQIVLVIDTLNGGEVEVAFAALPKLMNAEVSAFANEMVTAHGMARTANSQLAQSQGLVPAPSDVQAQLKASADAQVLAFQTSTAAALDAPYVESQVSMHTDALALAERLFNAAETPQLRNELRAMIMDISAHLEEAEAIRAEL
jgi:predicted outer membrane protein